MLRLLLGLDFGFSLTWTFTVRSWLLHDDDGHGDHDHDDEQLQDLLLVKL